MISTEYKAMQIYNELNILIQNNIKGRYDDQIAEKKEALNQILNTKKG